MVYGAQMRIRLRKRSAPIGASARVTEITMGSAGEPVIGSWDGSGREGGEKEGNRNTESLNQPGKKEKRKGGEASSSLDPAAIGLRNKLPRCDTTRTSAPRGLIRHASPPPSPLGLSLAYHPVAHGGLVGWWGC